MKESDKRTSHISRKLHMICIFSNNVRHPVTKTFTTLHYTSPSYTLLKFTTLQIPFVRFLGYANFDLCTY